jgi:ABC-type lipoprotein export system ATPase subunit
MALLELQHVSIRYQRGARSLVALDDVSLTLEAGQSVAIWGAARSGKTTLLRIAAGLQAPDQGRVLFDGRDLAKLSRRERRKHWAGDVGCLWRSHEEPRGLTVLEQVALPLMRFGNTRAARRRARAALEALGVQDAAATPWGDLSAADRVRVKLAHALIRAPRLLLADEPTAGLNVVEREQLLGLLDRIGAERSMAVLMTAPDAPGTLRSQRVASLDRGQLIEPERRVAGSELVNFPLLRRAP